MSHAINKRTERARQRIWEGIKVGLSNGEFLVSDVDEIEISFSGYFWENFEEVVYGTADRIWGELEGMEDVDMDFGDFLGNYFNSKKILDPVSELFLSRFVLVDPQGRQFTNVGFNDGCEYIGPREVDGVIRHFFDLQVSHRNSNGKVTNVKQRAYYDGPNQEGFDILMRDCYLTDWGCDLIEEFVNTAFDWEAFRERLFNVASEKLHSYREEKQKALEKKRAFTEEIRTYQALQTKLKKAGVI